MHRHKHRHSICLSYRAVLLTCFAWMGAAVPLAAVDSGNTPASQQAKVASPLVQETSPKALQAVSGLRLPDGITASLWATEPLLADPVAMSFDGQGRLYIAEHHRNRHGTQDTREHQVWLDEDRASRSVDDRLAFMQRHAGKGAPPMSFYTELPDRFVRVSDADGDGKADRSEVLGLFQEAVDGPAAGVACAADGSVWLTCIPHVWRLPASETEKAKPALEKMFSGFGVRFSFHGHDLHGMVQGPDGRLYWSIGDRGYRVKTREGQELTDDCTGSVFRCESDGSGLEVFATGLRNPQELVFDDLGNLFTVDNDNDAEDNPRLLHLMEGGHYGWHGGALWVDGHASPLTPKFRHPWYEDGLWREHHDGQPAWVLPAIAHLGNGPCGLTRDPGLTRLPDAWRGSFFLCDWRGGRANSPLLAFNVEAEGAGFRLGEVKDFLTGSLATDVTFGPDGRLYLADGVDWTRQPEGGRRAGMGWIWALGATATDAKEARLRELQQWLKQGFGKVPVAELTRRLEHDDIRARQAAQFALVERGKDGQDALQRVALDDAAPHLARVHALQGLGQIQRKGQSALPAVTSLLKEGHDDEVRAQVAKLLTDTPVTGTAGALAQLLAKGSPRARMYAALALGKTGDATAFASLVEAARGLGETDVTLRHMIVMGLVHAARQQPERLVALRNEVSPRVRLAALLALRRMDSAEVALFLQDAESSIVREAVRAVHDRRITAALPALAEMSRKLAGFDHATARRILNVRFRLGRVEDAQALAEVAANTQVNEVLRRDALAMLADWAKPSPVDRVLGDWLPLPDRDVQAAIRAVHPVLPALIQEPGQDALVSAAAGLAEKYQLESVVASLFTLAQNETGAVSARVAAARALEFVQSPRSRKLAEQLLASSQAALRSAGRELLYAQDFQAALADLERLFKAPGAEDEKRAALELLGRATEAEAHAFLTRQMKKLLDHQLPDSLALDVSAALTAHGVNYKLPNSARNQRARVAEKLEQQWLARLPEDDALRDYRMTLTGGNAERGRRLFHEKVEFLCVRCHRAEGQGVSTVGPDLTGIGTQRDREYLLRAIVNPGADIASGFEFATLQLKDGSSVVGIIRQESPSALQVEVAEAGVMKQREVLKADVKQRTSTSAMPPLVSLMTRHELRDLVEYLATQTTAQTRPNLPQ
ncbi:MAG: PVC-type heme-binding CxxCH protein [Opitutales bacterium]